MSRAKAWIDGASRGNPGEAGFGVLFKADGDSIEIGGFLGRTTNNVAEYAALIAALTFARRNESQALDLYSDSQLLVNQCRGSYKVKAPHLVPIFLQVMRLRRGISDFEIHHVPREENTEADRVANSAIDQRTPLPEWFELEIPQAP